MYPYIYVYVYAYIYENINSGATGTGATGGAWCAPPRGAGGRHTLHPNPYTLNPEP